MAKTVMITGISSGIGMATAKLYRSKNWTVIGIDKDHPPEDNYVSRFLRVDLAMLGQMPEELLPPKLDVLVNNAAVQICKPLGDYTLGDWNLTMSVNLRVPWMLARDNLPALKRMRGAIVNVGSIHAFATSTGIGLYAMSKGGLVTLSRTMALEFAPEIRVNAVLPGATMTPMLTDHLSEKGLASVAKQTPLGRVADPLEIAEVIYFLASPAARYITGQTLVADGGVLARLSSE